MDFQPIVHSELTFQLMIESLPNSIVLVNSEGRISYLNGQTEKLFGYHRSELTGQLIESLLPERYRSDHPEFCNLFTDSLSAQAMGAGRELFARRKDGSEFPVEIGLNPLVKPNGTWVLASIIDISERKKEEERFRLVVNSAPNAMLLVDKSGTIFLVNDQAKKMFDYAEHEMVGQPLEMLVPERMRQQHSHFRGAFHSQPSTRAMGAKRELFAVRKDGTEIPVEVGLNPIETKEGLVVLASVIDISERKKQEELKKWQLEMEARNKELEQFVYVASHDLQEPLRTVSNYVQILEEDHREQLDDAARNYLNTISRATTRMSGLIKVLLDFSRLGRYRKLVRADCGAIVEEALADLATAIDQSGAAITVEKMPTLSVFETEMRQLFQNLISNAIKFGGNGRRPEINISACWENNRWKFSVKDNGIGIDSRYSGRIFQIFQQLHSPKKYDGYGIGLPLCKKIVELHGGEIWVESAVGQGSTFYFTILEL